MSVTEKSPREIIDEKREKRIRVKPVPLTLVFWAVLHIYALEFVCQDMNFIPRVRMINANKIPQIDHT